MLQIGHRPGLGWRIWGCMEQVQTSAFSALEVPSWSCFFDGRANHQPAKKRIKGIRIAPGFLIRKVSAWSILLFFMAVLEMDGWIEFF